MKRRISLFLALSMILMCAVGGCAAKQDTSAASSNASSAEKSGGGYKLAYISSMISDEAVKYFGEIAQEYAEECGATLTVFDPNADSQKQANMVDTCIADGYDAIMITAVDAVAIVPSVKRAYEAGIPVIMTMCDIDESGKEYRVASVTSEHYDSGVYAAEAVMEHFPNGAKGVMIEGHPGEDTTNKRHDGFLDTIEGSNIEVIDSKGCSGWDASIALSVTEDFVSKYGSDIDFIYSQWDYGARSICQLLEEKGMLDEVYVVSVDGCRAGFDLVKEGKIGATMFQDIKKQSEVSVDVALKYLSEGVLESELNDIGWEVITAENCDFDPGW